MDAGKTTLAESLLFHTGLLRKLGHVDTGDTVMDAHALEQQRGITIFSSVAQFTIGERPFTLLDTPGHVDFSSEMERVLSVLDAALLVISGLDGVQAHTHTLWQLLRRYEVPTFLFVSKMDASPYTQEELLRSLQGELDPMIQPFGLFHSVTEEESVAMADEEAMEEYLAGGSLTEETVRRLIRQRKLFPCFFGAGIRGEGVGDLLHGLDRWTSPASYPEPFSARIFQIQYDGSGERLTRMKITGGTLRVRDELSIGDRKEKVSQLRRYQGGRFVPVEEAAAGEIVTALGLTGSRSGMILGAEEGGAEPEMTPVLSYQLIPKDMEAKLLYPKLKMLEEEEPQLALDWEEETQSISLRLMGKVQGEIFCSLVKERFGVEVTLGAGRVVYRETIAAPVEGVGHYEPLRHYAEVHLLMEPLERGSGIRVGSLVPEDVLDRNWQNLILTHVLEKQHVGVLTGSPVTDLSITLVRGRAHLKHTEGGDFRQATYRAIRQGLMQAKSILLEPFYEANVRVPTEQVGRVLSDLHARGGECSAPEDVGGGFSLVTGQAPVSKLNDYAEELSAATHGRGKLTLRYIGYRECQDAEAVIEQIGYDPVRDLSNPSDSVFVDHGAGVSVPWDKVFSKMHLERYLKPKRDGFSPKAYALSEEELRLILERAMGPEDRPLYYASEHRSTAKEEEYRFDDRRRVKKLLIDGYNVIHGWDSLREIVKDNPDAAKSILLNHLSNYAAYTQCDITVVFDAYRVPGGVTHTETMVPIQILYTQENESADLYLEKQIMALPKGEQLRVVTSDGLIQLAAVRSGILRMSAREFEQEVFRTEDEIRDVLEQNRKKGDAGFRPSVTVEPNP